MSDRKGSAGSLLSYRSQSSTESSLRGGSDDTPREQGMPKQEIRQDDQQPQPPPEPEQGEPSSRPTPPSPSREEHQSRTPSPQYQQTYSPIQRSPRSQRVRFKSNAGFQQNPPRSPSSEDERTEAEKTKKHEQPHRPSTPFEHGSADVADILH